MGVGGQRPGCSGRRAGPSPHGHHPHAPVKRTARRSRLPRSSARPGAGAGAGAGAVAGGDPRCPSWWRCRGRLPFPGIPSAENRNRGRSAHALRPRPPRPRRPFGEARAACYSQRAPDGRAVTSPGRPRPNPMKENVRRGTLPAGPSPCTGQRRDQSEPRGAQAPPSSP